MKTIDVPVLVIGAGAAGTMLSLELARYGVEHRIVDRLAEPQQTSKAITVHARTAEIFERIDERLVQRYLDRGIHNKGYVLHFVDAAGKRSEVRPGIDFTRIDSRYPYMLIHRQSETEQFLRDYLREQYDRGPEWGIECTDVRQDASGVAATLLYRASGEEETVRCQYLVACDGINSRVRACLTLSQQESDYAGTVLQNLDAYLNGFSDVSDYVHYCAGTDHFIMIVKLPGGFYRMLLSDRGEAAGPGVSPEEGFMRLVEKHFDGVTLGDVVWHSKWESWVRLADTYRDGNVFLAGDSAHVHSTTGGQGMNCCIQDAYNLGWKLGLVLRGLAKPVLLDTYESERRPVAEQVIWAASALHEIFMGHGKDIAERAEKIKDPEFLDAVVGRCSGISYTYRDQSVQAVPSFASTDLEIGDRAPDVDLPGGDTLYARTRHAAYTLFGFPGNDRDATVAVVESVARGRENYLRGVVIEPTPELLSRYGNDKAGLLYLIRPDGYIGFRCAADNAASLRGYLAEWLVP